MAVAYRLRVKTISIVSETVPLERRLDNPENAWNAIGCYLLGQRVDRDREHFGFAALDGKHRLLGMVLTGSGTATQAPVDCRQLWQRALALGAHAVVLFHTHPSGDLEPSRDDIALTQRLVESGALLGIPVHDHIILAPEGETTYKSLSLRAVRPRVFEGSVLRITVT